MGVKHWTAGKVLLLLLLVGSSAGGEKKGSIFANLSSPYFGLLDDIFGFLGSGDASTRCRNHTQVLLDLARKGDVRALKILDATGKPSSGVLEGGVFFIGLHSECVEATIDEEGISIRGKYCLVNYNFTGAHPETQVLPKASWLVLTQSQKLPTMGVCFPSSCREKDINQAISTSVAKWYPNVKALDAVCHAKEKSISTDPVALIILCFLLLFVAIAIFATTYDVLLSSPSMKESSTNINDRTSAYAETKSVSIEVLNGVSENMNGNNIGKNGSREILCDQDPKVSKCRTLAHSCFLAFSLRINAKKITSVNSQGEGLKHLHGLRFFSMALIIFGHTYSFATLNLFIRNPGNAAEAPTDFLSQVFANGTFAVDTFYYISGLLVCYVTLKTMSAGNGRFSLANFYIHRYFRLTPLMMAVIAFCAVILRYVGSGPNWMAAIQPYDVWCKENWWVNALYLHNFIHTENMCLSHTWYLATDMQFYIVIPLILIPLYKNVKYGAISILIFLLATTITTAVMTFLNHYPAIPYINNVVPVSLMNEYYRDVYIKPYCRIGPYIIGIIVGYYLLHKKDLCIKRWVVVLLWIASVSLGLTIIYLMWPANRGSIPTDAEAAAYSSLSRTLWAVTLGWLTIACIYGYGGFINAILSWEAIIPFSRLTYCAYLIHPVIMNVYYGCIETTVDFSFSFIIYLFLGNLCLTYFLAFILTLLFESPFIGLEKAIKAALRK